MRGGDIMMSNLIAVAEVSLPSTSDHNTLWSSITTGGQSFINDLVVPIMDICTSNALCLMFVSVTFVKLGVKMIRRFIGALGKGR